ncbi:uncharacterized protein [Aristolochia californica]|uniref:uncharacterized protein n=1 Tax=Aristolochia californica TaxID=171875 RepID=UPI0035E1EB3B
MGRSGADARCKKHPKHRQSPGVCSACLRERLSQLSSSNKTNATSTTLSSDVSSYYSSASSPVEVSFNGYDRVSFVHGKRGLFRSRTVAVVPEKGTVEKRNNMKKGGLWSKFIQATSKRRKDTAIAWVYARK